MDPPTMIHETPSFNLSEIWQFPAASGSETAGGLRRGQFGESLGRFMNATNQEVSGDNPASTVVEHGGGRRRDLDGDTNSDNGVNDRDGKRLKKHECKNENGDSEEKARPPERAKQDYIHVRARRGQATDSHSLAERARREKISERMKILQDLVPSCNKVIGKALVLDEIINYIQSLQRQVEFLSMKLETVSSRMAPDIQVFPPKEFGEQAFDTFGSSREYARGSSPEWLHIGGGFERTA